MKRSWIAQPLLKIAILTLLTQPAIAGQPRVYSSYDSDLDGYLNAEEFEQFAKRRRTTPERSAYWQFDAVDRDGNQQISEVEMIEALQRQPRTKGRGIPAQAPKP